MSLHAYLATLGDVLDAEVWTAIDDVGEAFDTYGRLVGDVFVGVGDRRVHVNRWLVSKGLVFPTYYTSMRVEEMNAITALAIQARSAGRGLWAYYTADAQPVDPRRLYRGKHAPVREERGGVSLPKLFRRRVAWRESNLGMAAQISFRAYLESRGDRVLVRHDGLPWRPHEIATRSVALSEVLHGSELEVDPCELVFEERPSWVSM